MTTVPPPLPSLSPSLSDNSTLPSAPPPASSAPDAGFPSIDSLDGPSFPQPQVNITDVEPESEVDKEMDQFQSSYPDVDDLLPAELKPVPIASNFTYGSSPYSPGPSTPAPAQASARPASPESEHVVAWRAKQAEEIKKRDEKSKEVREEKVRKAERDIDAFYEEYNKGKEQAIKENKCVPPPPPFTPSSPHLSLLIRSSRAYTRHRKP